MSGEQSLDEKISHFETLLEELKDEGREVNSTLKQVRRERKEIEKLLGSKELKKMVDDRVNEVVGGHLEAIGPTIRDQTNLIYDRVGTQIDKVIDLMLGKEYSGAHKREDLRPALAEKLGEWIRELIELEKASKP